MGDTVGSITPQHDLANHVPTAQKWRHFLKESRLSIEDAASHGSAHFMSGKSQKINVQIHHIHWDVGDGLSTIHQSDCPGIVCQTDDLACRIDGSKYIGHLCKCNQFWSKHQQFLIFLHVQ